MRLYIIGNGFDRFHGFQTSYWNYRTFLERTHYRTLRGFEQNQYIGLSIRNTDLWSDLESSLTIDYEECASDAVQNYYPDVMNDDSDSRWDNIDIELNTQTEFAQKFTGDYFKEWFSTIDFYTPLRTMELDRNSLFITFNYTYTLEDIYGINEKNIYHIHGKIDGMGKDAIQFGSVENDANKVRNILERQYNDDDFYGASIERGVNRIVDFCNMTSKDLSNNYNALDRFITEFEIDEIVVIGHSIMGVDFPYYENIIIPRFRGVNWVISYHTMEDYENAQRFCKLFTIMNYKLIQL